MACLVEPGLARVQETEVTQELAFRVPVLQFAGDSQRPEQRVGQLGLRISF